VVFGEQEGVLLFLEGVPGNEFGEMFGELLPNFGKDTLKKCLERCL